MDNDLVRYSRAGDVFHYRWAARRCLRMINPKSKIKYLTIEGSKESTRAGEYVIDVAEYAESDDGKKEDVTYFQLKHSTKRVHDDFNLSDLKDTVVGFARRFRGWTRATASGYPSPLDFRPQCLLAVYWLDGRLSGKHLFSVALKVWLRLPPPVLHALEKYIKAKTHG